MPQPSTLSYVADLVVRRVLANADSSKDIAQALEEAYPFDRSPQARRIWLDALIRHAVHSEASQPDGSQCAQPATAGVSVAPTARKPRR